MEVIFRISDDILIACIKGEVDHHSSAPLRNSIDKAMSAFGCRHLVMDFSGVEFMDSSGIGVPHISRGFLKWQVCLRSYRKKMTMKAQSFP